MNQTNKIENAKYRPPTLILATGGFPGPLTQLCYHFSPEVSVKSPLAAPDLCSEM